MTRAVRRWSLAIGAVGLLLMIAGCARGEARVVARTSATPRASELGYHRVLDIDFEKPPGSVGAVASSFEMYRSSSIAVDVLRIGEAQLTYSAGVGGGQALSFPSKATIGKGRIVLRVLTLTDPDPLSPGRADFAFGVDIRVDEQSSADDGDNVMQRGLFQDTAQYKIQLDDHRPSCRIAGNEGEVTVVGTDRVEPGQWYRLRCLREGAKVVLTVAKIDTNGVAASPSVWSDFRPTGSVAVMRTSTPISVGGKIATDGSVVAENTDQFNGSMDNLFFEVFGSKDGGTITPAPRGTPTPSRS